VDVFLKILSLIFIILLCLLGFILALLLLLLIVPVRYKGKGGIKEEDINFVFKADILFHLVSLSYRYKDEEPLKIKFMFFKLKKTKNTKDHKDKKSKGKTDSDEGNSKEKLDFDKEGFSEETKSNDRITDSDSEKDNVTQTDSYKESEKEDKVKEDKVKEDRQKEADDLNKTSVYDKIKKYLEIIKSDLFIRTFKRSKNKVKKIVKMILPRSFYVDGIIGFDDPSTTGSVLMVTSVLYPLIHKNIHICGDFENKVIDIKLKFKGHITLLILLIALGSLYFDKNIRKLIKLFREV